MKKVIKHPKKMKNAMYIVFGVFSLALFAITRIHPSYANEGLMIDDALDEIVLYGEVEQLQEDEEVEEVQDEELEEVQDEELEEDEDIVEPEETSDEEIAEEEKTSEDLGETVLERDNKEIEGLENGGNEENVVDNSEKIEENVAKGTESSNLDKINNKLEAMDTDIFTISFDTDGGSEKESIQVPAGSTQYYISEIKYSYTQNISENGEKISNYGSSWGNGNIRGTNRNTSNNQAHVISIPGAEKLLVRITYGGESENWDWVSMWTGSHPEYNAYNDYNKSIIGTVGKLGGGDHTNIENTKEYQVEGDTVTFSFVSDGGGYGSDGYGYYAIVNGIKSNFNFGENPTKEGKAFIGWYKEDGEKWDAYTDVVDGDITLKAHWKDPEAILLIGKNFNTTIKSIANQTEIKNSYTSDNKIKYIIRSKSDTNSSNKVLISDPESDIPVYARFDENNGTIYYYSEADEIYMNSDISEMFENMFSLKIIDLEGVSMRKVTNYNQVFYQLSSLETIYATDSFMTGTTTYRPNTLIGGNGTKVDYNNDNTKYFRPDTKSESGYFTDPREITLNFKVSGETYKSIVTGKGQPINQPESPELSGYEFEGWYTDENFTTGFDFSNGIEKFTNVYARMDGDEAILLPGKEFVFKVKKLADGTVTSYDSGDDLINSIKEADNIPEGVNKQLISTNYSKYEVWARYKNEGGTGTIYYHSNAPKIYMNTDSSYMFYKLKALKELDINMFDTTKVKSMKYMFAYTDSLETINLKRSNLSNVEDMSFMFYSGGLTSIDLSGMNLNKVTTMLDMFYSAKNLVNVDFTNIKLNSVTNIDTMFPYYYPEAKLEEVKFTNAELGNLKGIGPSLFYNLDNLRYVDFSGVDLHSLKKAGSMFNGNKNLTYINFDYADLRSLESISIFSNLPELTGLNFSHAILSGLSYSSYIAGQTPKVKEIDFSYADLRNYKGGRADSNYNSLRDLIYIGNGYTPNLEILNFKNADLRSLTSMDYLFGNTTTLKEVNFENTRLDSLATMENMFHYAKIPEKLIFKNNNMTNLRNLKQMFYNSYSGENIDLSVLNLSTVITMESMFYEAKDIKNVDFGGMDLSSVTNMSNMFYKAEDLENVNFSGTSLNHVSNMSSMFQYTKIKSIDLSNKTFENGVYMASMLGNISTLESADFSNTSFNNGGNMGTLFYNCTGLKTLDFSNTSFSGSFSMGSMLGYLEKLETVDFSNSNFSGSFYMGTLFYNDISLKSVNFKNSNFNGNGDLGSFFSNNVSLETVDFSNSNFSGAYNMYTLFYNATGLETIDFSNSNFNLYSTNMQSMFANLPNLKNINFDNSSFKLSGTNLNSMFYNLQNIETLNLSTFDTNNISNVKSMFENSEKLKTIYVSENLRINEDADTSNMFSGATSIIGGNGTTYDANHIDGEYARIDTDAIPGYFTNILDKPYTITYHTNEGILSGEKTTYTQRDSFTLPVPIRTGYTFLGWTGSNGLEPEILVNVAEFTVGNLEYTANWELGKYKIIFDTDGGNEINPIEKDYNSVINITLPTPTKECNEFSGWDAELPETMPAHDITLKAIWEYTCSRSSGGGGGAKKYESTTREIAIDTPTDQEHNSANEEQKTETSSNLENTTDQEIGQEIAIDGGTQKTVVVKNTEIVATVRNTTHSSSSRFTKEENDAYSFAKSNGITTTDSIDNAKMNTSLTRIEMAKMLSNFAINVLGQEPNLSKGTIKFNDVTNKMDDQYDNAVTKAYQLGIMGQNMKNNEFRPNDEVTRAEFASALSRLLYQTEEGEYRETSKYYIPHVAKLYNEGIINKTDPKIKEKRGYVMTMLMRTVQ